MTVAVMPPLEQDDRPPPSELDNTDAYMDERGRELDADVLAGIREMDGADGIKWSVSRVGEEDPSRNGFLVKLGTSQLTGEYLRNKFGGGRYYVRGNYPSGKYAAHRTFEIAADAPRTPMNGALSSGSSGPGSGGFDFQRFMAEQEIRDEARSEKRRRERMELLTVVGPLVAPIVAAMIGRQGPDIATLVTALKPAPPPDPLQQMVALKELMGGNTASDPVDRALKLFDVIADRTPSGGETGWADILKEAIRAIAPSVSPMIEAQLAARAQPLLAAPGNPGHGNPGPGSSTVATVAPLSAGSATGDSENPAMFGLLALIPWLKTQLAMALQKAQSGSNPELIAERIVDDLPLAQKRDPRELIGFITREDWFAQLCRLEPRCQHHQPWFEEMREAMLAQFAEAAQDTANAQRPSPMAVQGEGVQTIDMPVAPPSLTGK